MADPSDLVHLPRIAADPAADTEEERRAAALMERAQELSQGRPPPPPARPGPAGAVTPPEVLERLGGLARLCPRTGRPLAEEPNGLAALPSAAAALDRRNMDRFRAWIDLSPQAKTQLVADIANASASGPYWLCAVPADPVQPQLIVRAAERFGAAVAYQRLCGIRSIAGELQVSPYG